MKLSLTTIVLFLTVFSFAQNPDRKYKSHFQENGVLKVETNDGEYVLTFYSEAIIETVFIPKGEVYNTNSHAVVLSPERIKTTFKQIAGRISFGTDNLTVTIITAPFQIVYSYKGKPILSEKLGFQKNDSLGNDKFQYKKR
ncbi:DUF4968 domain-containing protein [Lacinutrix neustonica]|uniref:DUF4968 domain-containing protein n=1 Tax=Lacinutrix neustonica TaxID=2980107 RepID=A0A9E8MUV6_9FLAO|nr:alpha-glucosidase domain-containing protein [Lacinutrix neustonica]WAC01375.1 DUF4968 domain-containing protein [Lacinutrix neustonica]